MRLIRLLKNDIAKEAEEWIDDGIISLSQAESICQKYNIDYHRVKNRSLGYNILIGLGFLFIGLAIITLLGANWDDIPRATRMWGLISLTMAVQGFALRKYMQGNRGAAAPVAGLFFLGNLFYGASIILIAQVYHLGEHMPDGVFWWALGCLPIALLTNSPLIALQSIILAIIWFGLEISMGFYPLLFPIFILSATAVLYRSQQSIILFMSVAISTLLWVEYTLAQLWRTGPHLSLEVENIAISVAMFILAYILGHWLVQKESAIAKDYGSVLAVWSLRFGLITMMILSFEDPWRELIRAHWDHNASMFAIVVSLSAITLLIAFKARKLNTAIPIITLFLTTLFAIQFTTFSGNAIYFQVVYNIALIATGIWLILRGIHGGISHYFFLGVASILITAFMRYVDLIGDYIGGAALFMVFAVLLLGSAKYWKRHQLKEAGK